MHRTFLALALMGSSALAAPNDGQIRAAVAKAINNSKQVRGIKVTASQIQLQHFGGGSGSFYAQTKRFFSVPGAVLDVDKGIRGYFQSSGEAVKVSNVQVNAIGAHGPTSIGAGF